MEKKTIEALILASCLAAGCASSEETHSWSTNSAQERQAPSAELRLQTRQAITAGDWTRVGANVLLLDPMEPANRDVVSQALAMLGRDDLLAPLLAQGRGSEHCAAEAQAAPADALDEIIARARDHSVVVINEAHDMPRHRAFVERVVRALREEGYDTFAAETLRHPTSDLENRQYVTDSDGYYTRDPVFAQLLTTAMELGYRMVAYEFSGPYPEGASPEDMADLREQRQAEQLLERTFAEAPQARLVVLVGYGHAREEPRPQGTPGPELMMATHLKRMLGRDILTIDQTVCRLNAQIHEASDLGYLRDDRAPDAVRATDMQLVRGLEQIRHGRASWRLRDGRSAHEIPSELERQLRGVSVAVIEARPNGVDTAAIPEDRLLWRSEDRQLHLVLRPGAYELVALAEGRRAGSALLTVAPSRAR